MYYFSLFVQADCLSSSVRIETPTADDCLLILLVKIISNIIGQITSPELIIKVRRMRWFGHVFTGGASTAKEPGHFQVRTSSSQVTRVQKSCRPFLVALKT